MNQQFRVVGTLEEDLSLVPTPQSGDLQPSVTLASGHQTATSGL